MNFEPIIEAALAKRAIAASYLVFMDFVDAPKRFWPEFGYLRAGGHEWQGVGDLISIEGLQTSSNMEAPQTTFTLSGLNPELIAIAAAASDRVKDRRVTVFLQFFNVDPTAANQIMGNLGEPFAIWSGLMDTMRFSGDRAQATITLTAESLWASAERPPFGLYSYKDQLARFPEDKSLRAVQSLIKRVSKWPQ